MMQGKEKSAPVPGIWTTLAAGFDITAKHLWLTLIPVLLDSFFWIGPRLSFRLLMERMVTFWQQEAVTSGLNMDLFLEIAPRTNLFTNLSVPLVGVPALMTGLTPENSPLPAKIIELDSYWLWLLLLVVFSLVGLLFSALYWAMTAQTLQKHQSEEYNQISASSLLRHTGRIWIKFLGLAIIFIIVAMVVYFPVVLISLIMTIFSQNFASFMLLTGPVILIWLLVYLVFTPYGITLNGRSLWRAMLESFQLIRRYMLPSLSFILLVFVIGRGLDSVLLMVDDGSWLTWASIWGHAYVSTALLVAMFIFYRDRHAALFAES